MKQTDEYQKLDTTMMWALSAAVGVSASYPDGWLSVVISVLVCFATLYSLDRVITPFIHKLFNKKKK